MHERSESFGYESTLDTEPDEHCTSRNKIESVLSLSALELELLKVLKNTTDTQRMSKTKRVLESYIGSDWNVYMKDPKLNSECQSGYERVPVASHTGVFDLLVLSWGPGAKSPIHNHPCERCFLMALTDSMQEMRYAKTKKGDLQLIEVLPIPKGVATWISDDIGLHSVKNVGDAISYSLHCYVPGFTQPCTIYDPFTGISSFVSLPAYPSKTT